jgi:hypothetical protein
MSIFRQQHESQDLTIVLPKSRYFRNIQCSGFVEIIQRGSSNPKLPEGRVAPCSSVPHDEEEKWSKGFYHRVIILRLIKVI